MYNIIPYPGNKSRFCKTLHEISSFYIKDYFIEPFAGSGVFSLFLAQKYPDLKIILNEKDINVFKIHNSFKYGNWYQLNSIINEIWSFGDPKENKKDYYKARDTLNKKYFFENSIESGFFIWVISTFAINSMMRFGPHGFNQGWGHRGIGRKNPSKNINENKFNYIKLLYKNIELHCKDYKDVIHLFDKNSLIFLDPPYVEKDSGTYSFSLTEHQNFINNIKKLSNPVLYTDIFSENIISKLGDKWNYKILRDNLGVGKPGLNSKKIEKETVYFNFKSSKRKGKNLF